MVGEEADGSREIDSGAPQGADAKGKGEGAKEWDEDVRRLVRPLPEGLVEAVFEVAWVW